MAAQDLHAFITAFCANSETRRRLTSVADFARGTAEVTEIVADFADSLGYDLDARDFMCLDIALNPVRKGTGLEIVEYFHVFAQQYLRECHDPRMYNEAGVYDPGRSALWRRF